MTLFDSHCHLTDERFAGDVEATLERARAAGVTRLVTVASDVEDAEAALALARRSGGVWATAGVHPHVAGSAGDAALARVRELAAEAEVVALGETGLDYYYDNAPRDVQRRAFLRHLELAADTGLPIVLHAREADDDAAAMVKDAGPGVRGVLHCFAGGPVLLQAGLDAGWYVSFSGLVSFASYEGAALVRSVPQDRLLIETDSPYLAPVPRRGRRNEPAYVAHVAEAVAAHRGVAPEHIAELTTRNALRFYQLEG
ncbi:MAG TPA: TatD family hydrolase [Longimicrobiales bacterium]|nr:TatD family hydrolase [Longimicrobiales bacterium]